MINRRKFIRYSLIGAGTGTAILVAGNAGYKIGHFEKVIIVILNKDLAGLNVKQTDIKNYAKEISRNNKLRFSLFSKLLIDLSPVNNYKWLPSSLKRRYIQKRAELVGYFLLSTNFFLNKMDENKEIIYSGVIYDVDKFVCSNPFSGLQYQQ